MTRVSKVWRRRSRAWGALIGVTAVAVTLLPGTARAHIADCASISGSPTTVKIGQIITFHAHVSDWAGSCGEIDDPWSWPSAPGPRSASYSALKLVSGCGEGETSCVVRANSLVASGQPVHGSMCIQGSGWGVCAPYRILPLTLSGTVTNISAGHRPKPVAHLTMFAGAQNGAFNAKTVTNGRGQYTFKLAGGPYVIEAGSRNQFRAADPAAKTFGGNRSSQVINVKTDTSNVDFVSEPCGEAHTCPLKVYVTVLQRIHSGLTVDHDFPAGGPINFTIPEYSKAYSTYAAPGVAAQKCESGCANLLIGVIDPQTHKKVPDAAVQTSVAPIDRLDGTELLCSEPTHGLPHCGSSLSGLKTDANGQLHLVYWAPGEIATQSTQLSVTASGPSCTEASCPTPFTNSTTLTVMPNVIYDVEDAELSPAVVEGLVELARNPGAFSVYSKGGEEIADKSFELAIEKPIQSWVKGLSEAQLELAKEEAEMVAEGAKFVSQKILLTFGALVEIAHIEQELHEQDELVISFLSAFKLFGAGLGDPALESQLPALNPDFADLILHGTAHLYRIGTGGALWSLAQLLSHQYSRPVEFLPEKLQLKVYEVSYCDGNEVNVGHGVCGPGYVVAHAIHTALYFEFTGHASGPVEGEEPTTGATRCSSPPTTGSCGRRPNTTCRPTRASEASRRLAPADSSA